MSTILQQDDMNVGDYVTIHSCKHHNEPVSIGGLALKVLAIEAPYMVTKVIQDPNHPPITLDLRHLNLQRVSEAYAKAQLPQVQTGMVVTPQSLIEQLFGKKG